ncbi:MAG: hypothetical protein R3C02_12660 [Planctomycetaceae bacterium]
MVKNVVRVQEPGKFEFVAALLNRFGDWIQHAGCPGLSCQNAAIVEHIPQFRCYHETHI